MKLKTLFFSIFFCSSCSTSNQWFSPPPLTVKGKKNWIKESYCELKSPYIEKYIKKLKNVDFIPVDREKALEVCDNNAKITSDHNLYISRALYIGKETGDFEIMSMEDLIWINHESLAHRSAKLSKCAVLLILNKKPKKIFITAYADE